MDSRTAGALQEVVDAGYNKQFVTMLLQMDKALIGVDYLLQIYLLLNNMHERIGLIILTVYLVEFLNVDGVLDHYGSEYAACKVTAIRDEVDIRVEAALQVLDGLNDLRQMLMRERLVDADVVVAPAEVCGCTGLYACACAAGDGIHVDVIVEHQVAGQRQQCKLDCCCKATWIGYILALTDSTAVKLG